jgi:hypothetical protein
MSLGFWGAPTTYSSEADAKKALAVAQQLVDKLDVELRIQRSRKANIAVITKLVNQLKAATTERDRIKGQVTLLDAREKRAEKLAREADAKADAAYTKLQGVLKKEVLTRQSQVKEVNLILATNRITRDQMRVALFDADKAEFGLESALLRRIKRYTTALGAYVKRMDALAMLPITAQTKASMVAFNRENIEFLSGNIKLDNREIAAIRAAKQSGQKAVVTSPAALKKFQPGLLKKDKEQLALTPGAALPTQAELLELAKAFSQANPKRAGENQIAYDMRVRRFTYRGAIRLANLKEKERQEALAAKRTPTINVTVNMITTAVRDTVQKDAGAIEEEHTAAVFAPAGEQDAVAVVDAATNASAAVVAAAVPTAITVGDQTVQQFQPSSGRQQSDVLQVAVAATTPSNTNVAAFLPTGEESAATALPTIQPAAVTAVEKIDVAATIEQAKAEISDQNAAVEAQVTQSGDQRPRPFYKKPAGIAAIGVGLLAAVKLFSR